LSQNTVQQVASEPARHTQYSATARQGDYEAQAQLESCSPSLVARDREHQGGGATEQS
jgi:hypothetical protein